MVEFTWMTGGKQGSGIDAALGLFSRVLMSSIFTSYIK